MHPEARLPPTYESYFRARLEPVLASLTELDSQALLAEALWGSSIRQRTDEFHSIVKDLQASVAAFVANEQTDGEDFLGNPKFEKFIYSQLVSTATGTDNPLSLRIAAAVRGVEDILRPHFKRV